MIWLVGLSSPSVELLSLGPWLSLKVPVPKYSVTGQN